MTTDGEAPRENPDLVAASSAALPTLLRLLDVEEIDSGLFRAEALKAGQRIYGGLVVAQALVAAERTVEARVPHSLHGYFLLPGDPYAPIVYEVETLRDGGSFSTRRCRATQHGKVIFTLAASFQIEEDGPEHAAAPPPAPDPDTLPGEAELARRFAAVLGEPLRRYLESPRPVEMRPADPEAYFRRAEGAAATQAIWMRAAGRLPDDPRVHRALLAYMSDLTLIDTALLPHGRMVVACDLQLASLDHALWMHRPFRADEWLLYAQESPTAGGARGLTRGHVFSRDGRLVASSMQEGLMRPSRQAGRR
ncbi:acyl-CoA thioesterase II [Methylocella sp.]|uniref:acyl-CoA thioesterase II n=1 Tax=Methylocella sp. TaxID=1978226 RepID=UPI0037840B10